jgi:GNAT superfamily N-acetyltransferase
MELLLASLATCAAATIEAMLAKMRLDVADFVVAVDAERAEATPRVWTDIALRYHMRSESPVDRLERAVALTARTCPVSVMLARSTSLTDELYVVAEVDEPSTVDIRHRLLRAGMPRSSVAMGGDADATWFGVLHDGAIEGSAGVFAEDSPDGDSRHRLRAMATSERIRGSGLGRMLVDAVCGRVVAEGGSSVWASARTTAAGFYTKLGFEITSDEYDVEGIGTHVRMRRAL